MNRKFLFLGMIVSFILAILSLTGCKDSAAELTPEPELTSLTPNSLQWDAEDTTQKTIAIDGEDLDDATITLSNLSYFKAVLKGTGIAVAPKSANVLKEDIVETLTVSVKGGNSLKATLTHSKPVADPEPEPEPEPEPDPEPDPAPVPELTSLTPDALTWAAEETEAKTISVTGENLEGIDITLSPLTNYTASISGTTITVAPNAPNANQEEDVVETLTVTAGESSLNAVLTHTKAEATEPEEPEQPEQPAAGWKKVTSDRADWSGTYLFVAEVEPANLRPWTLADATNPNLFFITVEDGFITAAGTQKVDVEVDGAVVKVPNGDIALSDLSQYSVTIEKVDGGYTIKTPSGQYVTNTTGKAGIEFVSESTVAATSITMSEDNTFKIENTSSNTLFGWFNSNRKFNYFPSDKWDATRSQVSFYEYVTE